MNSKKFTTLSFTDVQGSTTLWEHFPEVMSYALTQHNDCLRALLTEFHGYEVKTEGDAFMVAFEEPVFAVQWCLAAQTRLLSVAWSKELLDHADAASEWASDGSLLRRGLRVRMGIHAGHVEERRDPRSKRRDFFGPVVNCAARIAHAAHGGQIVISDAVWAAIHSSKEALSEVEVRDLQEHRLAGIERAVHLRQILPKTLASRQFASLRTIDASKTNLFARSGTFVGRAVELEMLLATFDAGARLVTLLGPPGVGKSRLAARFGGLHLAKYSGTAGGGVWFCDLSEAHTLDELCAAVGSAAGLRILSKTGKPLVDEVGRRLGELGAVLVILDNFEGSLRESTHAVARWLSLAPNARLLVTSQQPLGLTGESRREVPPLALPLRGGLVGDSEAVQLFVKRATEADGRFQLTPGNADDIGAVVQRLDGLPLAIELAAARVKMLTPCQILGKLSNRFELLTQGPRDAPPRHATLRAALDFSWELLHPHEKTALAQCSVFRGGFSLDAAEAVVEMGGPDLPSVLDVIQSLLDKSLLRSFESFADRDRKRFSMLESLHIYAANRLAELGLIETVEMRHKAWFLALARQALEGTGERLWADYPQERQTVAIDIDNLLAAHARAVADTEQQSRPNADALELALAAGKVLANRGPYGIYVALLDVSLSATGYSDDSRALRARGLMELAWARRNVHRISHGMADLECALQLAREASDRQIERRILGAMGTFLMNEGKINEALEVINHALAIAESAGDQRAVGRTMGSRGIIHRLLGNHARAEEDFETALRCLRESHYLFFEGVARANLGVLRHEQERWDEAQYCYEQGLAAIRECGGRRFEGFFLGYLGALHATRGRIADADAALNQAESILREVDDQVTLAAINVHRGIAEVARAAEAKTRSDTVGAKHFLNAARRRIDEAEAPGRSETGVLNGGPSFAQQSDSVRFAITQLKNMIARMVASPTAGVGPKSPLLLLAANSNS